MYTLFRLPFFFFFNELFFPPHLYKFSLSIKEYPSRRVKIRTNPPRILSVSIRNCRRRRIRSRIMQSSRESTRRPETPSIILISSTGLDDPDTSFSKSRRLEIRGSTPEVEVGGKEESLARRKIKPRRIFLAHQTRRASWISSVPNKYARYFSRRPPKRKRKEGARFLHEFFWILKYFEILWNGGG